LAFTRVFLRTTSDGIQVRAYETPQPKSGSSPCGLPIPLFGEVSDAAMSGQVIATSRDSAAPSLLQVDAATVVGVMEGSPIWVTIVRTAPNVAKVVAHFPDGWTDEMAPVSGWAVLVHHASGKNLAQLNIAGGSIQAFGASGVSLGTVVIVSPAVKIPPSGCPPKSLPPLTVPTTIP
jgi:hypothetical protein